MSMPNSRLAYKDIYDIFDQALNDPKGIRLPFDSYARAKYFQVRMNTARRVDRDDNTMVYPKGDPMHGQSQYDTLVVRLVEVNPDPASPTGLTVFVYVEPRDKSIPEIESLTEVENEDGLQPGDVETDLGESIGVGSGSGD